MYQVKLPSSFLDLAAAFCTICTNVAKYSDVEKLCGWMEHIGFSVMEEILYGLIGNSLQSMYQSSM